MEKRRGMFIVFEGIDGIGKSTQVGMLQNHIHELDKYANTLRTREPTGNASEIRARLANDADAFSGGSELAYLYVIGDRGPHTQNQIIPTLSQGTHVLCDRYSLSTLAYQSAQGEDVLGLLNLHEQANTIRPDLTLYLAGNADIVSQRKQFRGKELDKFEKNKVFVEKLISQYNEIITFSQNDRRFWDVIGDVAVIDASLDIESVFSDIKKNFDSFFENWLTHPEKYPDAFI